MTTNVNLSQLIASLGISLSRPSSSDTTMFCAHFLFRFFPVVLNPFFSVELARVRLVSRNIWNPVRQNRTTTHQTTLWCYIPLQESGTREERGAFITPTIIWKFSLPFIHLKMRFLTRALKSEFDPK